MKAILVIFNITLMVYQNRFINEVTRAMTIGEDVCRLRGHNSAIITRNKIPFPSCACISELCSKFQTAASNIVGGVAETRKLLLCDMVKICMSFKGT